MAKVSDDAMSFAPEQVSIGRVVEVGTNHSILKQNINKYEHVGVTHWGKQGFCAPICVKNGVSLTQYENANNHAQRMFDASVQSVCNLGVCCTIDHDALTFDPVSTDGSMGTKWQRQHCCLMECGDVEGQITSNGANVGKFVAPGACTQCLLMLTCKCTRWGEIHDASGNLQYKLVHPFCQFCDLCVPHIENANGEKISDIKPGIPCIRGCINQLMCFSRYAPDQVINTKDMKSEDKEKIMLGMTFFNNFPAKHYMSVRLPAIIL